MSLISSNRRFKRATSSLLTTFFATLLGLGLPFLSGCATPHPKPTNAIEAPTQLRGEMLSRTNKLNSLRMPEVVLEYFGEGQRLKVRQLILVKRDSKLRIQTRAPASDEIMSLLVTSDGHFAMHDRRTNRYHDGPATAQNISLLLPVDLSPRDLVSIMLGGAPWEKFAQLGAGPPTLSWDTTSGRYRYSEKTNDGGELIMYVHPERYTTEEVMQLTPSGDEVWHYTTDQWDTTNELFLPHYRRFTMPSKHIDFSIESDKFERNPELPDILFQLEPPDGSTIYHYK